MHTNRSPLMLVACLAASVFTLSHARTADAKPVPAIDGSVTLGFDQDTSAIGRLGAGALYDFGRFALEGHVGFEGFLRLDPDKGIAARSFTLLDLGARYAFRDEHFVGPYVSVGGGFGIFTGSPHERKVVNEPEICATAQDPENCTYKINKNLSGRFGLGWGFRSSRRTTVGVRVDLTYWALSLNDFDAVDRGAPIPNQIPRPQGVWSVLVGLEFMRWK